MELIETQFLPYPYTHKVSRAERWGDSSGSFVRWFDVDTGTELPPYFGYGKDAQRKIDLWYQDKMKECNE